MKIDPLSALYQRAPLGMRLGLEPMREACARAGNPERHLRVVHVAGTNGKGSVCAMLESMARAAGIRTGLYTSPHLCRFAERIRIDGAPIDDDALATHLSDALELGPELSFFEVATLAAFLALRAAKVDLAILEVGLGGRLDATNVVPKPAFAAITRIALDHTDLLGTTLESIAFEKASIAKPGLEVIVGPMEPSVMDVIRRTCAELGATVVDPLPVPADVSIGLAGAHQRDNARIAWTLAARLDIDEASRRSGLAKIDWPGRLETIATAAGPVLLDAAHNPDGAHALARALADRDPKETALVFGALADKSWPEMIDVLAPCAAQRFYASPRGRAPAPLDAIAKRHAGTPCESAIDALARARKAIGSGLVVVCGSLHLVGEVRAALLGLPRDPPIAL
jgi:dihydrofolate synthase/folylpolyglutamate synthase